MSDRAASHILSVLQGHAPSNSYGGRGRPVDQASLDILNHLRGGTQEEINRARDGRKRERREQEQAFNARVRQRAKELRDQGVPYASDAAREQILRENAAQAREAERKRIHEEVAADNRAEQEKARREWGERAKKPVSAHERKPGDPYVDPNDGGLGADRVTAKLMAQYHGGDAAVREIQAAERAEAAKRSDPMRALANDFVMALYEADQATAQKDAEKVAKLRDIADGVATA
ncbi:hypothetical protein [Streptomyces sp. CoT10]|uniref:hypothetical protein n=1 Tax=Streptomyces sp. CoT10 TaxID=2875762 RepID=UPI001CD6B6C2|nr:hypothetical protein [Streptomyces sp. CoT10]